MPGSLSWWWYKSTAPTLKRRERAASRAGKPRFASVDLGAVRRSKPVPVRRAQRAGFGVKPVLITAAVIAVALAVLLLVLQSRMRPQVEQVAGAYIRNLASEAVNKAVSGTITRLGLSYDDLIHFEKDNQGRVTALKTDMVMANRVKSGIHSMALENISALAGSDIKIPIGTLLSGDLIVGRGPRIPVRLVPIGSVDVGFTNEFDTAGINQTLHRVMIHISANMSVMLPGSYTEQEVTVEVCVAETVIVGAVPDAYASLDKNPLFGG